MEISMNSSTFSSSFPCNRRQIPLSRIKGIDRSSFPANRLVSCYDSSRIRMNSSSLRGMQRSKSNLESLFCYDKSIPEEIIEKPIGLSLNKRDIGTNPPCSDCHEKGVILCATCSGSGLYVDSILESQGIIVKVRCLDEFKKPHKLTWVTGVVLVVLTASFGITAYCLIPYLGTKLIIGQ